ncbi:MAG: hypothetical protein ABXS91_10150, partial [Sulfurimonas sp.]
MKGKKIIEVSVSYDENHVKVFSTSDMITCQIDHTSKDFINKYRQDFAVWLFLPIAMRLNAVLHIKGSGTQKTIDNAVKMSQIWSNWKPLHFNDIEVTFENILSPEYSETYHDDTVCFYSGGID